ncbi:ParB/RepB/Spo0J family partition protein (plasmid) [Pseudomonas alloputida]|uniref:ParB/RepB/Spo0J family partition protein n=1 Tax=Pseudomonas alloputida TaxID=1940621 RepID=UPI003B43CFB9
MMAEGFENFLEAATVAVPEQMFKLSDIAIVTQVRPDEDFEDEEQTLEGLGKSLRKRQLQNIIVRPNPALATDPTAPPYELVIGGRRTAAAKLEGLEELRGNCYDLTDEEVEEVQLAENIHRKNLSVNAEAKRIQKDVDAIGVEATLAKHHKNRSWLSKMLSLLTLPPETNRLVTESITADTEVINMVKQVEKVDPVAAKELVNELKEGKGQVNQRETAKAVKDKVKPSNKKPKAPEKAPANLEHVATPRDESHLDHGPVTDVPPETLANDPALVALQEQFAANAEDADQDGEHEQLEQQAPKGNTPALPPAAVLDSAYTNIYEFGAEPKMVLEAMSADERTDVDNWLRSFYEAGTEAKNIANVVLQGFRTNQFADQGHGAFQLMAFLSGGRKG